MKGSGVRVPPSASAESPAITGFLDPEPGLLEVRQSARATHRATRGTKNRDRIGLGFDPAHPVELHAGHRVRETHTGKRITRALYAGDGNHRLALLMAAGHDELLPGQYRVKRYRSLVPTDSTGFLLRETGAAGPSTGRSSNSAIRPPRSRWPTGA